MRISPDVLTNLGFTFKDQSLGISEYRLSANGLKVLLVENHLAPVATVMVVYRVGSRNEGVGHTGSTHFLEHMMFKSTDKYDHAKGLGIDDLLKPVGAHYNATTDSDRTNYYECVPKEHLGLCLSIEADRMRNLRLVASDRASEMTVVRSEFEIDENDPASVLDKELRALAFREHPYHHPVIGWRSDVEQVPLERLKEFYDSFYWPDNATLIAVGDFEQENVLAMVAENFGKIPAAPRAIPHVYTTEPPQEGTRRFVLKRVGEDLPRVTMGFHIPAAAHPDQYALCLVRDLLGNDFKQSSRLYRALVEKGLSTSVSCHCEQSRDPGLFELSATVAPGSTPEAVEQALLGEVAGLVSQPAQEDELLRLKKANRNGTLVAMDDPITFANQVCQAEAVADWKYLVDYDQNYEAVTLTDIERVVKAYFQPDNMTVGHYLPQPPLNSSHQEESAGEQADAQEVEGDMHPLEDEESTPEEREQEHEQEHDQDQEQAQELTEPKSADESLPEDPQAAVEEGCGQSIDVSPAVDGSDQAVPAIKDLVPDSAKGDLAKRVVRRVLPNGMTLLLLPVPGSKVVSVAGTVKAGDYFAPPAKRLMADLTASMLKRGSAHFTQDAVGQTLEQLGTELDFDTGAYSMSFGSKMVFTAFADYLELLSDVLLHPLFDQDSLTRWKQQYKAALQEQSGDAALAAHRRLAQELYTASHVHYEPSMAKQLAQLESIDRADVCRFHKRYYSPSNTTLVVVGAIEIEEVAALIDSKFGSWTGKASKPIKVTTPRMPAQARRVEVPMEDKASVEILIGVPTELSVNSPDWLAAKLGNAALGQDTVSSKLGAVVREKHGLTYGIYSSFADTEFGGAPWLISLSVNPANADKALALVGEVMADFLANGLTDKELEEEAGRAYGSFVVGMRDTMGIAKVLAEAEFSGKGIDFVDRLASDLRAVTKEQVSQAIKARMRFDRAITVLAGVQRAELATDTAATGQEAPAAAATALETKPEAVEPEAQPPAGAQC